MTKQIGLVNISKDQSCHIIPELDCLRSIVH